MLERFITFSGEKPRGSKRPAGRKQAEAPRKHWVFALYAAPLLYGVFIASWALYVAPQGGLGNVYVEGDKTWDSNDVFEGIRRHILLLPLIGILFLPPVLMKIEQALRTHYVRMFFFYEFLVLAAFMFWLYFVIPFSPRF